MVQSDTIVPLSAKTVNFIEYDYECLPLISHHVHTLHKARDETVQRVVYRRIKTLDNNYVQIGYSLPV